MGRLLSMRDGLLRLNVNHKYERRNSKTLECCWLNGPKKDLTTMGYKKELIFYEATYKCEREKSTKCQSYIRFGVCKKTQLIIKSVEESHNHELHPNDDANETDTGDNFQAAEKKAIDVVLKRLAEHMDSTPTDERHQKLRKLHQLLKGWEKESSQEEEAAGGSQLQTIENEDNDTSQVNLGDTQGRELQTPQCDDGMANAHFEEIQERDVPTTAKNKEKTNTIDKATYVRPSLPDISIPDSLGDEIDSDFTDSIFEKINTVPLLSNKTQQTVVKNAQTLNFNDLHGNSRPSKCNNSAVRGRVASPKELSSTRTQRDRNSEDSINAIDAPAHKKKNSKTVEGAAPHDLSKIKMPTLVNSKGRPLGTKTTAVVGLRRQIKKPLKFDEKPRISQIKEMLQWLEIPPERSAMILKGEIRIKVAEIDCNVDKIRNSFAESDIDILQKYMESGAFAKLQKLANAKTAADIWICEQCHQETTGKSIFCEGCLVWFHYKCAAIKKAPKKNEDWFCSMCSKLSA